MNPSTAGSALLPDAPQVGASWTAVVSVGLGAFALVTSEFLPVGLLPQIASELGISAGQAGLMVATPGFTAVAAAPLTLAFAGKLDRRHVLWALIALLALANLAVATAHSFTAMLLGRILLGIAIGGFWTIGGSQDVPRPLAGKQRGGRHQPRRPAHPGVPPQAPDSIL